jgi:hypothetical protein
MSQCSIEPLFQDLLSQQDDSESVARRGLKHNATDLVKFVDKFLKEQHLMMTMKGFNDWCTESREFLRNHPVTFWQDKEKRRVLYNNYVHEKEGKV